MTAGQRIARHTAAPLIADVQALVAEHFRVRPGDLTAASRARAITRPRQVGMYLAHMQCGRSYSYIGGRFGGRDHSTVMYGVRAIRRLRGVDRALDRRIASIEMMIEQRFATRVAIERAVELWP